jgi:hypothetical protein
MVSTPVGGEYVSNLFYRTLTEKNRGNIVPRYKEGGGRREERGWEGREEGRGGRREREHGGQEVGRDERRAREGRERKEGGGRREEGGGRREKG